MKCWIIILEIIICSSGQTLSQSINRFWRDTLCQNNMRLSYMPQSLSASFQAPPVYDFVGNTLVQVYSGIAAERSDTNLSYSTLINGFGNLSLFTFTPLHIHKFKAKGSNYYSDLFTVSTGTIPDQSGTIKEVMGTVGLGINNTILFKGDLNKLYFVIRHKIGGSFGKYPGLTGESDKNLIFYHSLQFRIRSALGAVMFEFPLKITPLKVKPSVIIGYYKRIGQND